MREGDAMVRLHDGRGVQCALRGPETAPPVLYCHGVPGSGREIDWAVPVLARRALTVRLVAPSRPGYGRSTWAPLAGFSAWAADAAELLDRLGIRTCAVLGASGGAPFALALARLLPDRVTRLAVAAGVGPPRVPAMQRSATFRTEPRNPRVRALRYGILAAGYRLGIGPWLQRRLVAALGAADRLALSESSARATLDRVVADAFAQRGRAAAHEAGLLLREWDFDPAEVDRPVRVWHGMRDTRVPVEVGRSTARLLPQGTFTPWPQHGHFSWAASDGAADVAAYLTEPEEGPRHGPGSVG